MFDYQSECHCSKTDRKAKAMVYKFDYQSECHCSKTIDGKRVSTLLFDYQSECHCSKTEMPQFSKIHTGEEYNLHSAKVLKEARKAVGLSRFSKKYEDAVIELMGWDPSRYALDGKKPFEVVAYALDYEAQGFSNALSKAIAERF